MWISFAPSTLKPACSMRLRIAPAAPLATASGLMMASVRCVMPDSPRNFPRRGPRDGAGNQQPDADDERHPVPGQPQGVHQHDADPDGREDRARHHEPAARRSPRATHAPMTLATVAPMSAGLLTTVTPAPCSAFIFSAAVPLPPAMIAPACPIRRPGGAV